MMGPRRTDLSQSDIRVRRGHGGVGGETLEGPPEAGGWVDLCGRLLGLNSLPRLLLPGGPGIEFGGLSVRPLGPHHARGTRMALGEMRPESPPPGRLE